MSKVKRFWICMALGVVGMGIFRAWLKDSAPLVDQAIVVVSGFFVLYWALRYLYEHWDD